jgi:hypothetical protein
MRSASVVEAGIAHAIDCGECQFVALAGGLWPKPGNKKPTLRWVRDVIPPRSSAVGVISLLADMGDSMPMAFLPA